MTRDDLFNTNAGIVKTLVEGCGKFAPDAVLAIISNPNPNPDPDPDPNQARRFFPHERAITHKEPKTVGVVAPVPKGARWEPTPVVPPRTP